MVNGCAGPVALNVPYAFCSIRRIVHSPRSRASMNWTGSLGSPGARTSPPRAMRIGQYEKRSLLSPAPTAIVSRIFLEKVEPHSAHALRDRAIFNRAVTDRPSFRVLTL